MMHVTLNILVIIEEIVFPTENKIFDSYEQLSYLKALS